LTGIKTDGQESLRYLKDMSDKSNPMEVGDNPLKSVIPNDGWCDLVTIQNEVARGGNPLHLSAVN